MISASPSYEGVQSQREDPVPAAVVAAVAARARIVDLTIEEPEIEDIVRRIYMGDGV